ncbi:MAG: hypothetical protein NVSMB49_21280 [Ktedonobacteraceae bacterium]
MTRYTAEQWNGEKLLFWLQEQKEMPETGVTFLVHSILSALTLVLIVCYVFLHISPFFCIVSLLGSLVWFMSRGGEQKNIFQDASYMQQALGQLRVIFEFLEKYPYAHHQHLRALCKPFFDDAEVRPSFLLRQLKIPATMATTTSSSGEASLFINALLPWKADFAA